MPGDPPGMRCVAVLVQIDAFPGSEYGTTAGDWNRKAGLGEGRANVGKIYYEMLVLQLLVLLAVVVCSMLLLGKRQQETNSQRE